MQLLLEQTLSAIFQLYQLAILNLIQCKPKLKHYLNWQRAESRFGVYVYCITVKQGASSERFPVDLYLTRL